MIVERKQGQQAKGLVGEGSGYRARVRVRARAREGMGRDGKVGVIPQYSYVVGSTS